MPGNEVTFNKKKIESYVGVVGLILNQHFDLVSTLQGPLNPSTAVSAIQERIKLYC